MFQIHKKPQGDAAVKKSVQKILDPRKDNVTRMKHLRVLLENVFDPMEQQAIFEQYYSHIYYVFFENFLTAEASVRQKGAHRAQREELESMLQIFEAILVQLPEMLHERWQYNSIDRIIKTLLHPGNTVKTRRDGIKLFLLWFRALRENARESTVLLFACVVPGFPSPPTADDRYKESTLVTLLNPVSDNQSDMCLADIGCLIPSPPGENGPPDETKYFLDAMLEFMVLEARKLQWKDPCTVNKSSFSFLWDMFKRFYLPHIFQDFRFDASLYLPDLSLPEPREPVNYILNVTDTGSIDPCIEVGEGCPLLPARVSTINWVVAFTGNAVRDENKRGRLSDHVFPSQESHLHAASSLQDHEASHSNTSTLTDKAPSLSSLSSLDDKLKSSSSVSIEEELVREVLYSTKENVNIVHEIFRQALMLPLTEAKTMKRVVKVYQEWIQEGLTPIFMEDPNLSDMAQVENAIVQAGRQTTYQLFITNSAHVFLVEPPNDAHKLVQAQVDVCKRVLNLYRHMVMHVSMDSMTWTQLLQVLLHFTRIMLQDADTPAMIRVTTVAGKLAGPVFQTLIVSWIKANLFVHVSRELWDELVDVLSSLVHWKELIVEWAKNMDTMTRVLARHVYGLELSDLPLDRLTEQKQTRNRKVIKERHASPDRSFTKGLCAMTNVVNHEKVLPRMRSQTEIGTSSSGEAHSGVLPSLNVEKAVDMGGTGPIDWRGRSVTVLVLEPSPETDGVLRHILPSPEFSGHLPLKRGKSDTSDLSSSPPTGSFNLLTVTGGKNDNLQRCSSTSDISSTKIAEASDEDTHQIKGQFTRQRCNSGPQYREQKDIDKRNKDVDAVTSLSSVEDAFNDMFDELATQRLSRTHSKIEEWCEGQHDVESIKSHDSGSIDPNWNPWAESSREEKEIMEYLDFKKEDEWGSCLEDSNFGIEDEVNSSADSDSSLTADDYDFSSTTATRKHSGPCSMTPNLDVPFSTTTEQLEVINSLPATFPGIPSVDAAIPNSAACISTNSSPTIIWDVVSFSNSKISCSNPCSSLPIIDKSLYYRNLGRTKSHLSYTSTQRPVSSTSSIEQQASSEFSSSLIPIPCHLTFPFTKLSNDGRVVEPVSSGETSSCPIKISHSMQCFPCFNVEDTSSEAASPGMPSPPYHIYKRDPRDRYDSTALLIPEPRQVTSRCGIQEGIMELNETPGESLDTDTTPETSYDDILGVQTSAPFVGFKHQKSIGMSNITPEGDDETVMQLNKTDSLLDPAEDCSILAGGRRTGWYPDVAVALWRRLLGILGDINKVGDPVIHQLVFTYLLKFCDVLFKLRENIGITADNLSSPSTPELVPPLRIMAPWAFKAVMSLPDSHKGGCLHAYQLLCNTTLQHHDTRLEPEHLALFYLILHDGLHSDQDKVNEIVESCSPNFFSCLLPASTLLLLDFIYACHSVAASTDLSGPRSEAQTILGSVLCFPNLYCDLPVLNPDVTEPRVLVCNNIKEYVADALLTSAKKEPSAPARCVALSSLGVWLYEELTSPAEDTLIPFMNEGETNFLPDTNLSPVKGRILARHGRVKEAINVMLVSLKFNNRNVASVACSQLHLLTHCMPQLLEYMPEMPSRIIEVVSLTVSSLLQSSEAKSSESGRLLLVSLLLCICDWCMIVPLSMLIDSTLPGSDKRLIRTVFKALQTGALGKPGHSAKHSYSLSDLASKDFDPNLHLDKVLENSNTGATGSLRNSKLALPPMPNVSLGADNVVSLTASTVLSHLTNHLGHFPLLRGPAVLNSLVTEQQDHGLSNDENISTDLTRNLFNSPNVQFLIYNDSCLLSLVEIPAQKDIPGGGPTVGLTTAQTNARIIVRDTSGKFCWDSSILYGGSDIKEKTKPVSALPLSTLDQEISKVISELCHSYISYAKVEIQRKRKVVDTPNPFSNTILSEDRTCDNLDQLLQYIGYSSPECQESSGRPLNIPGPIPKLFDECEMQTRAVESLLQQHELQSVSYSTNTSHNSCQSLPAEPRIYSPSQSLFHQSRLIISQTAFLSKENRRRVTLLKKNEKLLRELKNLDSRSCRETHKVAVIYIAPGQEDKLSILSNTAGSKDFEDFVSGIGWEIDLKSHCGFRGKLHSDGSTGTTSPYYATSTLEVVFHVSTRFPSMNEDSRNIKLKHLGNDEVHIIWSDHNRDYRRGIIPTEFGDVLIIIYPMRHMLYRIQINKKIEVPYFGPLFDGAIVNARVLPVLVRETAINAGRAKRSQLSLYQPFYEERARYLHQIIDQFRDDTTFEDYAAQLFSPGQVRVPSLLSKSIKQPFPKLTPVQVPSAAATTTSSPINVKILPLATQSSVTTGNSNGNNNHDDETALRTSLEGSLKRRHPSNESSTSVAQLFSPHIKEPPPLEEVGPRYTPGHQVSGSKATLNPPSSPTSLQLFSTKALSNHFISMPRPKPSSSHPTSISALSFSQTQQQVPTYATSIPASTKIHIPVSKLQLSVTRSTGTPPKHSPGHAKAPSVSASSTGI